jgi:hypothetical protein
MFIMKKLGLASLTLLAMLAGLPTSGQQDQAATTMPAPAASLLDLTPDANGNLSQDQMRQLIRVVTENYRANYKKERDYTYIDFEVEKKLDAEGRIKSTESKTYEIMELYGEQVQRLIAKDDKPLSEKDVTKEEERIGKLTSKRKNESTEERAKRHAEEEKQREKNREFVREVADAYDFRVAGSETLDGRDNWVIAGEPRPGFQAHLKDAQMLSKFRGRLWIDKNDLQLAKMDVEAIDTVSFGWVLARIHKGTRLVFEQTRVNEEVWLPQHISFKFDARVALFKGYNEIDEETFHDYKKFRATARIVNLGDAKP